MSLVDPMRLIVLPGGAVPVDGVSAGDLQMVQDDLDSVRADALATESAVTALARSDAATRRIVVYSTRWSGEVVLDAGGHLISVPRDLTLYSTRWSGLMTMSADGRLIPGARPAADPTLWHEGADYAADQSLWAPDRATTLDMILGYGQSYTLGDVTAAVSTTPAHPGTALMLGSAIPRSPGALADLVAPAGSEPPVVAAVNRIVQRLSAALGTSPRIVGAALGQGGQPYRVLKRGSPRWVEVTAALRALRREAEALGLRPVLRCVLISWGESDARAVEPWQAALHIRQLRADLEDEARRLLGQSERVCAVLHSPNRSYYDGAIRPAAWMPAVRAVAAAEPDLFAVAGPTYGLPHDSTNHPTAVGYRQLGALMGEAALRLAYGTGGRPCDVTRVYWTGATTIRAEVHCPDGSTLVRDESGAVVGYPSDTAAAGYIGPPPVGQEATGRDGGWWATDPAGQIGVVSAVVSGNGVNLTLSRAGQVGATRLMYAVRSQSGGVSGDNSNMARGVFRSSSSITVAGTAVHDWLLPYDAYL